MRETMYLTLWMVSLSMQLYYAKQISDDIKDIILQSQNEESHLAELVKLVLRTTSTPPWAITSPAILPFFELGPGPLNVSVQLGSPATLHCKVNQLTDKATVSWLRRDGDKLKLVAVGLEAYSAEPRYTTHHADPNDWQLKMDAAQHDDQGHYECHVSSHPPISLTFFLTVVVPELIIADERGVPMKNKYYNSGSTIELKCQVSRLPEPSQFILWWHGDKLLNYDTTRGGISVKTDIHEDGASSKLYIANAGALDSGNYTCALADVANTTVAVVILNGNDGEAPAAMHVGCACRLHRIILWILPLTMFIHFR